MRNQFPNIPLLIYRICLPGLVLYSEVSPLPELVDSIASYRAGHAQNYWICTTFPRERRYRTWFLKTREHQPLLDSYRELGQKFPQGLADVQPLAEELSGEVNAAFAQTGR